MNLLQSFMGMSNPAQVFELGWDDLQHTMPIHFHLHWKDRRGKYIDCNNRMIQDLGSNNKNDLLGLTDFDFPFLSAQEARTLRKNDSEVIAKDKSQFFIEPCTLVNGKKYMAFSQKSPLKSRSNKIIGSIGFSLMVENEEASTLIPGREFIVNTSESSSLSTRQADCLFYLVKGMTMKQTANILKLSPRTIEHYLYIVQEKLNCKSRAELIAKALQIKIISDRL